MNVVVRYLAAAGPSRRRAGVPAAAATFESIHFYYTLYARFPFACYSSASENRTRGARDPR